MKKSFEETLKAAEISESTRERILNNTFVYQGGMYESPEELRLELIRRINESIFGTGKLYDNASFERIAYKLERIEKEIDDEFLQVSLMF